MANLFGQLDLTKLGDFVRQNPSAVKVVRFKDGSERKFINISINERKEVDQFGRDHYIKSSAKDQSGNNINCYFCDLKTSNPAPSAQVQNNPTNSPTNNPLPPVQPASNPLPEAQPTPEAEGELPF